MNGETLLESISRKSDEHEFFTPIPPGYKPGKVKYVITFGTVLSGLGKGIFSSALAMLLKNKGLKVAPLKMEGYLNIDSGTLNPFRHGEVFVLDDGMECDMDLGTYERFLDINLTKSNFLTNGQILGTVLEHERKGDYLGRDVQFIPHVTGEIKRRLRQLAVTSEADVVFIEVGGTVGDLENMVYIEAIREMAYEEGKANFCFVCLSYILKPKSLGEQKSKAAQLGIQKLIQLGIQPDIVALRAENPVTEKVREKVSIYTNVHFENVFSMHDSPSIYTIPERLFEQRVDKQVIKILGLEKNVNPVLEKKRFQEWKAFADRIGRYKKEITIGITGKYTSVRDSYASIIKALEHCEAHLGVKVNIRWIDTTDVEKGKLPVGKALKGIKGIIVPGGFGARGVEGKIKCIEYVRKNNIPYLGLCYGFQMAVVEFARNVCRLKDAHTSEVVKNTPHPVIDILPEQKKIEGLGGNMRLGGQDVQIKEGTKAYQLYGNKTMIRKRFRHRFECNPAYLGQLEKEGMVFSGKSPKYPIMQILELPKHQFFVGTQFHPELTSRPLNPDGLFMGFVKAAMK